MSSEPNQPTNNEEALFEEELIKSEEALSRIRQRYAEIKEAQPRKEKLEERLVKLEAQWAGNPLEDLETEVKQIKEQLQELEVILESNLLGNQELKKIFWDGIRRGLLGEVFWQIVRFGGLGVLLGWVLKSCAG